MNVNVEQTRQYYASLRETDLCDCAYCKSYRSQIKACYPDVAEYLAAMGIEIEKPFETSPLEPDENGMLEYCACEYVVFGSCLADYHHEIGGVNFFLSTSHAGTGIKEAHFVLGFAPVRLKFNG